MLAKTRIRFLVLAVVVASFPGAILAEPIEVSLKLTVSTADGALSPSLIPGDQFLLEMVVEDATPDTLFGTRGNFAHLVSHFTLTRSSGNAGFWPAAGTYDPSASAFSTNSVQDNVNFVFRGSNFADAGPGLPFREIQLETAWGFDVTDSGVGDGFAEQLAPGVFGLSSMIQPVVEFRFLDGSVFRTAVLSVSHATAVVPDDFASINDAVQEVQDDHLPGTVIVRADGPFDESVNIAQSVTLEAAPGFQPVLERSSTLGSPINIRTGSDAPSSVVIRDMELRIADSGPSRAVSISNVSTSHPLDVSLERIRVEVAVNDQGIRLGSGNGLTRLSVIDSFFEVEGDGSGSPSCILIDPSRIDVELTATGNTFRFSRASGVAIRPGVDGRVTAILDRNLFQGFDSPNGSGRTGLAVSGINAIGAISTDVVATNNVFERNNNAVEINGQASHLHEVQFNNNTVVDSAFTGVVADSFGSSRIDLRHSNNIIVGSGGAGHRLGTGGRYTNGGSNNLYFENADGPFEGFAFAFPDDVFADPHFVDAFDGDYRLQSPSPAIDGGNDLPDGGGGIGLGVDFDGFPRQQDGDGDGLAQVDIGAIEVPEPAAQLGLMVGVAALLAIERSRRSARRR